MTPTQPAEAGSVKRFWVADEDVHERTPINIEFGSHDIYVLASDHDAVCELLAAARLDKHELRAERDAALARLHVAVDHINHSPRCAWMQPVGRMECDCGYREALDAIGPLPPRPGNAGETL